MKSLFKFFVVVGMLFSCFFVRGQVDTTNPYKSLYNLQKFNHWTDQIKWSNVESVADKKYSRISTWDSIYYAACDTLAKKGGGVVYFPSLPTSIQTGGDSTYKFNNHLYLRTNVVIRGDRSIKVNATDTGFAPRTLFEFPKYNFNGITNVPNSTAFKFIVFQTPDSAFNTGIVDVDINRAILHLTQTFNKTVFTSAGPTVWPTKNLTGNIIVLSVRQNNAAVPDPSVPSTVAPQQLSWQRYPYRLGYNININGNQNIVVCNNRINDFSNNTTRPVQADNFQQPGYIVSGATTGLAGSQAIFDYAAHYGLLVNRLKQDSINLTISQLGPYKSYLAGPSTPTQEPNLFAPGVEIRNNWIYKTQRVGIQASGNGLIVSNNVLRDNPNKQLFTNGTGLLTTTTNLENSGIDFTGWNVLIDGNDIEVERTNISASNIPSSDGNGFYSQPSSSATVLNHIVRNNVVIIANPGVYGVCPTGKCANGYTLWNVSLDNIQMYNNNSGQLGLIADARDIAATITPRCMINNVRVYNNSNINIMTVRGEKGGSLSYAYNNIGYSTNSKIIANNTLTRSCNVSLSLDSTNFNCTTCNPNFTIFSPQTCCADTSSNPGVNPSPNCVPTVILTNPSANKYYAPTKDTTLIFKAVVGVCTNIDSAVYFFNNVRIGRATYLNDTASFSYTLKKGTTGVNILTIAAYKYEIVDCSALSLPNDTNATVVYSNPATLSFNYHSVPTDSTFKPSEAPPKDTAWGIPISLINASSIKVFPNPFSQSFTLELPAQVSGNLVVSVNDLTGRQLLTYQLEKGSGITSQYTLNASSLETGVYFLQIGNNTGKIVKRLIKE